MAVNLSPVGGVAAQFFDNDGNVLSGGKIYTYAAGSSTPAATYTTGAGIISHSNPIILDSSGRVPSGEIWLTDGISYKFVLNNSSNTLIGTYDNITGINSNFINFLAEQEIQTATAGQTVFTLTTTQYQPGTNTLSVFVDGVNQYGPGAQYAYTETSSTVVTFTNGLHVGAVVKFTTTQTLSGGAIDSSQVVYDPPFTGGVQTTVAVKLSEYVSVFDFMTTAEIANVQGKTATLDVSGAIQAALNSGASTGGVSIYFPKGVYAIDTTILIPTNRAIKMYGDGFNPQEVLDPVEGTVIKWIGAANGTMFSSNVSGGANTSGLIIRDMRFDGDNIASIGMIIGADSAHPQHEYFENIQFRNFAFNGTDAALDLAGGSYSKYGVADANFVNVLIDGGARALRISSQQLNFYGGAIGAKNGSILVELGDNSHPKFYGTGFYSGPGNPLAVFGIAGTVGIDGLECYGCWNEGQKGLIGRLGPTFSPAVSAYRVIFNGQRSACVSGGTHVIDLTGLNCNLIWDGGYNDNLGQPSVYLETGSTMTVYQLQAGGFTYTGAGTPVVTEYRSNGVKRHLGVGLTDNIEFNTNIGLSGLNSVGNRPSLIRLNGDDLCALGDDGLATLTKLSNGPSANFPAGAAKYNGVVGVDSTNGWLVFYVNGTRYKLVGTSY